jgi:hypothetical protein
MRLKAASFSAALVFTLVLAGPAYCYEQMPYQQWKTRCLFAPSNRSLQGRIPAKQQLPLPDFGVVQSLTLKLLRHFQTGDLAERSNWVGPMPKTNEFFDIKRSYFTRPPIPFQPFTQKQTIPVGSKVVFHGDFHGDIRSFIATIDWLNANGVLDGFKIKDHRTYLAFLGDYVDRGAYGVEVLYTLMRLKLANPDQVLLVRGNHEDFQMTARYGFLHEGQTKYGKEFSPMSIWRMYDFLPVAIYLGVGKDYIQCNHGGMEPGYDPTRLMAAESATGYQLLGELRQKQFATDNPNWLAGASATTKELAKSKLTNFSPRSPVDPAPIGFMWNDYMVFADEQPLGYDPGRLAFVHGKTSTAYLLQQAGSPHASLHAVFRAHQHSRLPNAMMNRLKASHGVFRHWQASDSSAKADADDRQLADLVDTSMKRSIPEGSVWTFNVSPDSVYGVGNNYTFDTIGILETAAEFSDWRLRVVNVPVK